MSHDALDIVGDTFARLSEAVRDRRNPMHTPVVATSGPAGPDQRVMVLRGVDAETLRFHTEARSSKLDQLRAASRVHVLGYDAAAKVQLRLTGDARMETTGPTVDAAWAAATAFARRCYLVQPGPGTPVDAPVSGLPPALRTAEPDAAMLAEGRVNFALLLIAIDRIDWLYLAHDGHRRAVAAKGPDGWTARWVIP